MLESYTVQHPRQLMVTSDSLYRLVFQSFAREDLSLLIELSFWRPV